MGKAETVHFSFAIVLSDTEMQMISNPLTEGGQGHLVTFIKSHLVEYFKVLSETSTPGCIANNHFGTVKVCLQKIGKFIVEIYVQIQV